MSAVIRSELVARARELAPGIAERAAKTEELRCVPEETFLEFRDAGLLRAFVLWQFGGYALEFATVIETAREVGSACGSSARCLVLCALHNRMVGILPRAAQEQVFRHGPDAVVCGVFMPGGTATPVEGGYRLTGRWDFASGCDHADHAVLAAERKSMRLATFSDQGHTRIKDRRGRSRGTSPSARATSTAALARGGA